MTKKARLCVACGHSDWWHQVKEGECLFPWKSTGDNPQCPCKGFIEQESGKVYIPQSTKVPQDQTMTEELPGDLCIAGDGYKADADVTLDVSWRIGKSGTWPVCGVHLTRLQSIISELVAEGRRDSFDGWALPRGTDQQHYFRGGGSLCDEWSVYSLPLILEENDIVIAVKCLACALKKITEERDV